jgi:hypothetical protein
MNVMLTLAENHARSLRAVMAGGAPARQDRAVPGVARMA